MTRLTLYYDARCGLCCAVRDWLNRQPLLMPLECRPRENLRERTSESEVRHALGVGKEGAPRERVSGVRGAKPPDDQDDLIVRADSGEEWRGDSAWLMVLWALRRYRPWAYRLAAPELLPVARTLFATLSAYRGAISCGLGLRPEQEA